MRFLFKVSFPVEAGNQVAKKDAFKTIGRILEEQKPDAAYFTAQDGKRSALLILNLESASEIPAFAEPWFLALDASIETTPVMVPEDLQKASPAIERAVKDYGQ